MNIAADGPAFYDDDTACDVRDDYVRNLKLGLPDDKAAQAILGEFGALLDDVDIA